MDIYNEPGYAIARLRIEESDNNYNYIVWCTETKECAVIDPIDPITILISLHRNFAKDSFKSQEKRENVRSNVS